MGCSGSKDQAKDPSKAPTQQNRSSQQPKGAASNQQNTAAKTNTQVVYDKSSSQKASSPPEQEPVKIIDPADKVKMKEASDYQFSDSDSFY